MVSCITSYNILIDYYGDDITQVFWEWNDDTGLWQAFCNDVRKSIEVNYLDQVNTFTLGDPELSHHYNLGGTFTRTHPRSKITQRLRRTPNIWDRPEGEYVVICMASQSAFIVDSITCGAL